MMYTRRRDTSQFEIEGQRMPNTKHTVNVRNVTKKIDSTNFTLTMIEENNGHTAE